MRSCDVGSRLSSTAGVQVAVLSRSLVQLKHQWAVRVGEVGGRKKARCAEEQIVPMPVEAQLRLATFCAWNVGRAE